MRLPSGCGDLELIVSVRPAEPPNQAEPSSVPYDEMLTPAAAVRPHYTELDARLATLSPDELAERQKTQERFFLLQGITFTVYGAESSTERIIPTDILPRIIPGAEWTRIEAGLIQRLRALNMFLADIYSDQKILMDGVELCVMWADGCSQGQHFIIGYRGGLGLVRRIGGSDAHDKFQVPTATLQPHLYGA